jgi:hypothetical protein
MEYGGTFWSCITYDLLAQSVTEPPAEERLTDVVGEFHFASPVTAQELASIDGTCGWCFEMLRVKLVRVFLSRNGMRAILVFRAPDAESVRSACRTVGATLDRSRASAMS